MICAQAVKDIEKEMKEIVVDCQNLDLQVKLVTPYYDSSRDRTRSTNDEETESTTEADYDYLKAFLPKATTDTPLSKSD